MRMSAFLVATMLLIAAPAYAASDDVPENIQGRWVDKGEACEVSSTAMVISATSLVYADGRVDDVLFEPDGDDGIIRPRSEDVSSYEYVAADDTLLFRPEGFGMGSTFAMLRCQERTSIMERRCGWLANLTPGDWWLVDGDRTWTLSGQGENSVAINTVMDMVPGFEPEQFISTGTDYGYGCACMTVTTDSAQGRILGIASSKRQPLATCSADKSLPAFADW